MDEITLFVHRVTFNKEDGIEGELIITSKKISFECNDVRLNKNIAWANINYNDIKYSSPNDKNNRVIFRISFLDNNTKPLMFFFIGPSKDICKNELQRLKKIIEDKITNKKNINISNNNTSNNNNNNNNISNEIVKSRKRLLDADRSLKILHEEFVDKDKIMTSDDFWKSHENQLNGFMIDNDSNNITKKGKQTTIFSDFRPEIKRNNNGEYYMNIKITSNDKENIFLMYPSVKKAYDNEVPDRYTEEEFWILYFQSEFYNKDKAHDGLKLSSGTDDIFSRYELLEKEKNSNEIIKKHKISDIVDPSIDLTSNFGDYRPLEILADEDKSKRFQSKSNIVNKYNRHSQLFMENIEGKLNNKNLDIHSKNTLSETYNELNKEEKPKYIKLNVQQSQIGGNYDQKEEEIDSVFKKSTNSVKKTQLICPLQNVNVNDLLVSLNLSFPSSDKALEFFHKDKKELKGFTEVAKQAALAAAEDSAMLVDIDTNTELINDVITTIKPIKMKWSATDIIEGKDLSEEFKQEMYECFNYVTGLLRCLYALMRREGAAAPCPGSQAAEKADRINTRLMNIDSTLRQRRGFINNGISNESKKEEKIEIMSHILKLIERATTKWESYKRF